MRPLASLSLDLDNQWSYMKTHGDPGWSALPSYLDTVAPLIIDLMAEQGLTITVFVVGQDAVLDRNREAIASLAAAGHEIGNHSFSHEPWLHLYEPAAIETELDRTEDAIEAACGVRPTGFRGPGYSVSEPLLRSLARRGYAYDASTLPTFIGPLARAYYFRTAKLSAEERRRRGALFGRASDGLRPVRPYRWALPEGTLLEVPVTTLPLLRVPMHVSYVLYLEQASPALARRYFRSALQLCRLVGVQPSILLHPLDLLGGDEVEGLRFFPGMALPGARKRGLVGDCLAALGERFEVLPVGAHAARLSSSRLPLAAPLFAHPDRPPEPG